MGLKQAVEWLAHSQQTSIIYIKTKENQFNVSYVYCWFVFCS